MLQFSSEWQKRIQQTWPYTFAISMSFTLYGICKVPLQDLPQVHGHSLCLHLLINQIPFQRKLIDVSMMTKSQVTTWKRKRNLLRLSHANSNIRSSTDKSVFRDRQSSVRRLLPASDYCRACGNQIVEHSSRNPCNETVLGSSRKLGGAAEHLIDGSEKLICRLSFEF